MSHYCVYVFHAPEQSVESLLAPYDENNKDYFRFKPVDMDAMRKAYEGWGKEHYATIGDYLTADGCFQNDEGVWGYMANPDARWDWWAEGGRYDNLLALTGEYVDEGVVSRMDWSPDEESRAEALEWWDKNIASDEPEDQLFFRPEYYLERYGDRETYAATSASRAPYAFVSSDGAWHERGRVGWFAIDDATKDSITAFEEVFARYVKEHPDEIVTVVDCHI